MNSVNCSVVKLQIYHKLSTVIQQHYKFDHFLSISCRKTSKYCFKNFSRETLCLNKLDNPLHYTIQPLLQCNRHIHCQQLTLRFTPLFLRSNFIISVKHNVMKAVCVFFSTNQPPWKIVIHLAPWQNLQLYALRRLQQFYMMENNSF